MKSSHILGLVAALGLAAGTAAADQVIGGYDAWIGSQDLYNSNGERLTQAWQVLRQDRANLHRFNRGQPGDEWDPWFGDADNRAALERLLARGLDAPTSAAILRGNLMVHVTLWADAGRLTWAQVTAYD